MEFTRSKENLASVLKKIGGLRERGSIRNPSSAEFRHFFLASPEKRPFYSTHPPLEERVWILDPAWDGSYYDFSARPCDYLEPSAAAPAPAPVPASAPPRARALPISKAGGAPLPPEASGRMENPLKARLYKKAMTRAGKISQKLKEEPGRGHTL